MRWIVIAAVCGLVLAGCHKVDNAKLDNDKFDLSCTGTTSLPNRTSKPFHRQFRVSLTESIWCSDECESVDSIPSITDKEITFRDDYIAGSKRSVSVDRYDESLIESWDGPQGSVINSGKCERKPFSGFPKRQF